LALWQKKETLMTDTSVFWDAIAPHLSSIEDNYFDLVALKNIIDNVNGPVLVVGAGQGLIVEELQKNNLDSDGVDYSYEMIRLAKKRRGIELVQADAKEMPFEDEKYQTTICTTGVLDFILDSEQIKKIINEMKRVTSSSGKIYLSFMRYSLATEEYLKKSNLLKNEILSARKCMEAYLFNPFELILSVSKRANISIFSAFVLVCTYLIKSSSIEMKIHREMQKILKQLDDPSRIIENFPEKQMFRNEESLRKLLKNLDISIKRLIINDSCFVVEILG
jgi:ubiquinone/menaquinone biosynthesis C-methylase UbiE